MGEKRVEGVELSDLDENGNPIPGNGRVVPCDTLLLSVGLIPENELASQAGVELDPVTNGAVTDQFLQTSVSGIFSCGNARKVMDLADFVTDQGQAAGRNAARFVQKQPMEKMPPETSNAMAKGLPQPGAATCILCPKGCRVTVRSDGAAEGNGCPKGKDYAFQEQKAPQRVLTTTLKRADGTLVPVKSSKPLPRESLLSCVRQVREVVLPVGDVPADGVVLKDPFGVGVDLVAALE